MFWIVDLMHVEFSKYENVASSKIVNSLSTAMHYLTLKHVE